LKKSRGDIFCIKVLFENRKYYFYTKDYLGNNRETLSEEGNVLQKNRYYPFGLPMAYDTRGTDLQPFKYNGKEFDTMHGLNQYDYHARQYDAPSGRFTTVDPLAEKYYSISPYAYCGNNPIKYVDPTGMLYDVYINGSDASEATKQLNNSTSLTITRDEKTGKLSASGTAKTKHDKKLLEAINSEDVTVQITANSDKTIDNKLTVGGSFLGNSVITITEIIDERFEDAVGFITFGYSLTKAITKQQVNPEVLENMDNANNNTLGTGMLHETLESYEGGLISFKKGVSSPPAGQNGSVYDESHNRAPSQGAVVTGKYWNAAGKSLPDAAGAVKVEIISNGKVIMTYP